MRTSGSLYLPDGENSAMNCGKQWRLLTLLAAFMGLAACETLPENLIEKP